MNDVAEPGDATGRGRAAAICKVRGCGRGTSHRGLQLCHAHYMRLLRGDLKARVPIREYVFGRLCRDCNQPVRAGGGDRSGGNGRCARCQARWHAAGRPAGAATAAAG